MCGIAGSVNFQLNYPQVNASMGHRGPDAQNGYRSENIDLYHLRLSIVDIAGGQQPMHLNDRYTIIFNGEIYNHLSLRKQFQLQTTTASDTETLLLLYQIFGIDFLQYVDGMFVFALYDKHEKKIVIARDRAGKKPLYYFNDGKKFVFASELNALNALLPLEIDTSHFHQYLRLGAFYRQSTPYKNVLELGSGSYLTVDTQTLKVETKEWWNIHPFYQQQNSDSFETSKEKVDQMLHEGIRRRVESSDLEVGSFLSGGIDSGLVTAIASQYNKNLKTFTVSFEGEYDEAP
ncbi:MAG: asparagine synthetase B family protein, partial [Ferruginibacter sp.]